MAVFRFQFSARPKPGAVRRIRSGAAYAPQTARYRGQVSRPLSLKQPKQVQQVRNGCGPVHPDPQQQERDCPQRLPRLPQVEVPMNEAPKSTRQRLVLLIKMAVIVGLCSFLPATSGKEHHRSGPATRSHRVRWPEQRREKPRSTRDQRRHSLGWLPNHFSQTCLYWSEGIDCRHRTVRRAGCSWLSATTVMLSKNCYRARCLRCGATYAI